MRLTLIVAATKNLGIGKDGALPWRLKKEMQYFARVTTRIPSDNGQKTTDSHAQNAVIMGRKTWDSIPIKFRPLKDRVNVVLSSTMSPTADDKASSPVIARNLDEAISLLQSQASPRIVRAYVIGGYAVYRAALERAETDRVLLTRVEGDDWECDTFFPVDLDGDDKWRRADFDELKEWTGEEGLSEGTEKEGSVEYEYRMYVKK